MRFYPNNINKNAYKMIYREDTYNYTADDILREFKEWVDIISNLIDEYPVVSVITAKINKRLTSTCARVFYNGRVEVSEAYLKHHGNAMYFHSTICHEAIHTFRDCWDHNKYFHTVGRYLEYAGFNVKIGTTTSDAHYIMYATEHARAGERDKYKVVCRSCGEYTTYKRKADIIKHPNKYRCRLCHGSFRVFEIKPDGIENELVYIAI